MSQERGSGNRDLAIDATRGVAIWSMVTAHFATDAPLASPTHAFPYVDGMSAFVMLSGIVLGLVYQRWATRHGLRYAYVRLAKRIAVLYVCQLVIALVAVAAALAGHRWLTLLLPVDGWIDGIWLSVTMQYLPSGGNILLLYMVLMVSAFALFPLLQRGWWAWTVAVSLALYVLSRSSGPRTGSTSAPTRRPHIQNVAGWQIMFIPSVVIGWNWSRWRVPEFIDRWLVVIVAVAVTVALFFHYGVDVGPWAHLEPTIADKLDFRPARAIGAYLAIPAIYGVFRLLLRWWHHDWLRPLVMTGTRSLDSYVIQAIALVVVPIHIAHRPWDTITMQAVALLVFGICWAWAEFRYFTHIDKLHKVPGRVVRGVLPHRDAAEPGPVTDDAPGVETYLEPGVPADDQPQPTGAHA
ncbi:OpgC domain-containing protein [Gordonia amicalis]|uniref:OpgC domain-containing protein n=1 Tax=Gordonia amicalis TaxID=89053 RepID=UPI00200A66DF|nr:OpgC domain-containing protein [Gordonia amicalis]UPW14101.1 OpgC domain-containing protein [Gordonia amicalis]